MALFGRRKNDEETPLESETVTAQEQAESSSFSPVNPLEDLSNGSAEAESLASDSGLMMLVRRMISLGEGQMTLSLKQDNEDMQLRLYNNGSEVESSIVKPQDDWFAPVAKLYTDEEEARGTWNRALVVINPPVGDELTVQASYLNTVERTSNNLKYLINIKQLDSANAAEKSGNLATGNLVHSQQNEMLSQGEESALLASSLVESSASKSDQATEAEGSSKISMISERFKKTTSRSQREESEAADEDNSEVETAQSAQSGKQSESVSADTTSTDTTQDQSATNQEQRPLGYANNVPASLLSDEKYALTTESKSENSAALQTSAEKSQAAETAAESKEELIQATASAEPKLEDQPEKEELSSTSVTPAHNVVASDSAEKSSQTVSETSTVTAEKDLAEADQVHTDESKKPSAEESGSETNAAATAEDTDNTLPDALQDQKNQPALPESIDEWDLEDDTFESAPSTASKPDVTSFVPRVVVMPPSSQKLADGNLVLSEADVVSRLMPAQDALFGTNGTALDAASVLVRIRSLGSYYDALTHVRRNGFWDQQRTFDLIPEGVLKALELKAASYKEGSGAPLAISIRFTPGIPPLASFNYTNEEAFVEYGDTLPAQQYIEELRMFPRTGANIPPHMSEALTSWAL